MARLLLPIRPALLSLLLLSALPRAPAAGRVPHAPPGAVSLAACGSRQTCACRNGEDVLLQRSHKIEVAAGSSEAAEAAGVVSVVLEGQGPEGRRRPVAELGLVQSGWRERLASAGVPLQTLGVLGHAMVMGAVYALIHAAGPDHLGTLMTLSAAAGGPARAFKAGAAWGAGHCLGMVVLVVAFVGLGQLAHGRVAAWEHYGDYLIGASMIACAVYFAATESKYVQQEEDGTEVLRGCACHGPGGHPAGAPVLLAGVPVPHAAAAAADVPALPAGVPAHRAPKRGGRAKAKGSINSLCTSSYGLEGRACLPCPPPEPPSLQKKRPAQGLSAAGALLGVFQAACCPSGMIGISFILKLPAVELAAFCASFAAISVLGTGLLALCWSLLASTAACRSLSAKALYRASCGLTLALGVAWIVATFNGVTLEFVRAE